MLDECFRILKPGGLIRTATPDMAFILDLYSRNKDIGTAAYLKFYHTNAFPWAPTEDPVYFINNFVRDWGHQFIYDRSSLEESLLQSGFKEIRQFPVGTGSHPELSQLENPKRMPEGFLELESIILEAQK